MLFVLQESPELEGGVSYQVDDTEAAPRLREVHSCRACATATMRSPPSGNELQEVVHTVRTLVEEEQNISNLKCSTSDEFLLRFIRASHYQVDTSFHLIKKYFKAKIDNPEAFIVQSPAGNIATLQRKDLGLPLRDKDKCGRRVLNIKFGRLDPSKESWTDIIQSTMMVLEAFSLEEDVQENGVALILDCTNFSLKIMKWATPHKIRTVLGFFQECIPLKFEAVHIINYPYIFNVFASALKPFMNDETKRKLIWHNELSSLEQHIDKPKLPVDLGGELKPEEVEDWYQIVLEKEELFSEFRKMGYMK